MPKKKKVDRRIQRTRALLRDALMRLIVQADKGGKSYDQITVQDITDEANVARTTFYLHFKDKDDLLFSTMRDLYETLFDPEEITTLDQLIASNEADCVASDFEHVQEYSDFYQIMLGERGSAAFLTQVRQFLAESIMHTILHQILPPNHHTNLPLPMMAYAIAGAQIAVIKWWLDNGMQQSPKQVAFMLQQLQEKGLPWALNVEEPGIHSHLMP